MAMGEQRLTDQHSKPALSGDSAARPPALVLRQVSLAYDATATVPILKNINLNVANGESLCIVGPSGCGKTSLLRMIAGHVAPSAGEIEFEGCRVTKPARSRAIVFQDYNRALLPWRTVSGNVELAFEGLPISKSDRRERVHALLVTMGLAHAAEQYPSALSGGMQQRVQIARCLAQEPKMLLMDEPFGALDAMTRQGLQDEVSRIASEKRLTVIFITHDLEEAIYFGDRVASMGARPGEIIDLIDVDLARPRNQLRTREDPRFLAYRHRLFHQLESPT
jgi:NitT/TauT family transport system ATP-binding protein